jgi:glycosyltransferase involved in cell wall biosynthesis
MQPYMNEISMPKYGILVATKDRPKQLEVFLKSVANLTMLPNEIVVSSSGVNIENVILEYTKKLNLKHIHSLDSGQVLQKKAGLNFFSKEVEWIAFFDDDISLSPNSIENVFKDIATLPKLSKIAGVGFACANHLPLKKTKFEFLRKVFLSSNQNLGQVNKSGYNASYMESKFLIETQWLNGASIWRANVAKNYDVPFDRLKHAIGEDLIFSYNNLGYGSLFFSADSKFVFQQYPEIKFEFAYFKLHTYIQLYFILSHKRLSKWLFLWRFSGSTFFAFCSLNFRSLKIISDINHITKLFFDIVVLIVSKKTTEYVLRNRINI